MAYELVVTEPFGLPDGGKMFSRGDHIVDPETMAMVERDFSRHTVRRTIADLEPVEAVEEVAAEEVVAEDAPVAEEQPSGKKAKGSTA